MASRSLPREVMGETACINPEPAYRLNHDDELILIGNEGAIGRFFKMHPDSRRIKV